MSIVTEKRCTKCGETKHTSFFYRDNKRTDKLTPWCKACMVLSQKARKERDPEAYKKYTREQANKWYHANIEKGRASVKKWRENNREKYLQSRKRTHEKHAEKEKAYEEKYKERRKVLFKKWIEGYRETRKQRERERWATDPEYRNRKMRFSKVWKVNNPDNYKQHTNLRRARKRQVGGKFSRHEWKALCEKYDNKCLCCGKTGKLTPDHVVPLSKGGSNDISNIQPLCPTCNFKKFTKTIDYRPLFKREE